MKKLKSDLSGATRRDVLRTFAQLGGGLMMRSFITGVPAKVLLNPLSASAADLSDNARFLIWAATSDGDPVNANVPGMYVQGVSHPSSSSMVETALSLSGTPTTAAKPWANLSQSILDRTAFVHLATRTQLHGDLPLVYRIQEQTEKRDMLISLIARELAPKLNTAQTDPLSLGAISRELLTSNGRPLANVAPTSVRDALAGAGGPLETYQSQRDKAIDALYKLYRDQGKPGQLQLLDQWALSKQQVRNASTTLIDKLQDINGNDETNQGRAAAIMCAMRIAPAYTININFGGDNHTDSEFKLETAAHQTGVQTIQTLIEEIDSLDSQGLLSNSIAFCMMNVFGRTLTETNGRDHYDKHNVAVCIGKEIKGSIIGGIEKKGSSFVASSFDAETGAAVPAGGGNIKYEDTLSSLGKTLARWTGIPQNRTDTMIVSPGRVISAMFKNP